MGTCSSIFIEFKKGNDPRWHLLDGIVPLDYRDRSYCNDDASPDDNHIIEIGGVKMYRMFNIVRQGCVRDLFAGHDAPFNDRGFPDDLSPELKEMFDKVQKKIDSKENVGLFGGDWRWGKSWCSLSELNSYLAERIEKCKANILAEHSKQLSYGITEKLDAILAAISGKPVKSKKKKKEEDEYIDQGEMLDYYMNEELNEIIWLKEFAAGISFIHEFLTDEWLSESSLRLVFYAC